MLRDFLDIVIISGFTVEESILFYLVIRFIIFDIINWFIKKIKRS